MSPECRCRHEAEWWEPVQCQRPPVPQVAGQFVFVSPLHCFLWIVEVPQSLQNHGCCLANLHLVPLDFLAQCPGIGASIPKCVCVFVAPGPCPSPVHAKPFSISVLNVSLSFFLPSLFLSLFVSYLSLFSTISVSAFRHTRTHTTWNAQTHLGTHSHGNNHQINAFVSFGCKNTKTIQNPVGQQHMHVFLGPGHL